MRDLPAVRFSPDTSSLLRSKFLLSPFFSNNLNLRNLPSLRDRMWHPHKITSKVIVLHILISTFLIGSHYSSVGIVTTYGLGEVKNFLFSTSCRPVLGSTQPPIQWVQEAVSLGVKRLGREANHSPPASVEVKKGGAMSPLTHKSSSHRA
jgi:hypothetical protein